MSEKLKPLQHDTVQTAQAETINKEKGCFYRCLSSFAEFFECDQAVQVKDIPPSMMHNKRNRVYREDFDESYSERLERLGKRQKSHQPSDNNINEVERLEAPTDKQRLMKCLSLSWWIDFLCCSQMEELKEHETLITVDNEPIINDNSSIYIYQHDDKFAKHGERDDSSVMGDSQFKIHGYDDMKLNQSTGKFYRDDEEKNSSPLNYGVTKQLLRKNKTPKQKAREIKTTNEAKGDTGLNVQKREQEREQQMRNRTDSYPVVVLENKVVQVQKNRQIPANDEQIIIDDQDLQDVGPTALESAQTQGKKLQPKEVGSGSNKNIPSQSYQKPQETYDLEHKNASPIVYDRTIAPQKYLKTLARQDDGYDLIEDVYADIGIKKTTPQPEYIQAPVSPGPSIQTSKISSVNNTNEQQDDSAKFKQKKLKNHKHKEHKLEAETESAVGVFDFELESDLSNNNNDNSYQRTVESDVRKKRKMLNRAKTQQIQQVVVETIVQQEIGEVDNSLDTRKKKKKMRHAGRTSNEQTIDFEEQIQYNEEFI